MKNNMPRGRIPGPRLSPQARIAKARLMAEAPIAPKKPSSVKLSVGQAIYRDMNPMGKKIVDYVAKKTGYVSPATRAGMRRTDIANRKGQLGKGWR